jgi:DNA replication initiation complex subunit (GINS family)
MTQRIDTTSGLPLARDPFTARQDIQDVLRDLLMVERDIGEMGEIPVSVLDRLKVELDKLMADWKAAPDPEEKERIFFYRETVITRYQDIVESRLNKLVLMALETATTGTSPDTSGMLEHEKIAYNQIVERLLVCQEQAYQKAGVQG